jgi:hypothetical protein
MKLATLRTPKNTEPIWHVQLAILAAIGLQIALNDKLAFGRKFVVAGFEILLLVVLTVIPPHIKGWLAHVRKAMAILLIALVSIANAVSLGLVINALFSKSEIVTGRDLLISGLAIYLTNVIIFGLWYWELDSGSNSADADASEPRDFLFPQMGSDAKVTRQPGWQPSFFDYFYVSATNASAFSPTDTMPLTHRAKLLMSLQSVIALITIALVAARAVNILG